MNKKYILAMTAFIIYLLCANSIILSFFSDERLVRVNFSEIQSNSEVYYNMDSLEELGGLLERYYAQGWAYCETETDNTGKTISIILKNTSNDLCYKIDSVAGERADVYGVFRDEKKIYNEMNGLECQFSSINIKNGIYELYLYVKENDVNYGLTNTGYRYVKDRGGFRLEE